MDQYEKPTLANVDEVDFIRTYYRQVILKYEETSYYSRYPLNLFWASTNMQEMQNIIDSAESWADVIHGAQRTMMFSVNVPDVEKELAVDWLLEEQQSRGFDLFSLASEIEESSFSYPQNNALRQGRRLTPDFLRTVNISNNISSEIPVPTTKLKVIELGGGLGHLARTMRLYGLTRSHIIIDIPETLVFSYCFLKQNFPDARFLLVDDTTPRDSDFSSYDFVFVPALFAEYILTEKFDLFINTASMGEMNNVVIRYWMDFIQNRLWVTHLYTLNRYLNTIIRDEHQWRLDENECSVHYDARWSIMQWEVEPSFTRCPYVDTQVSRYVEIIAHRLDSVDTEACHQRAEALIEHVKHEDWYRMPSTHPPVMTMRDNILVHDMRMTGTLFKLWDALRLYPTAEASAMILQYLSTLLRYEGKEFEEVQFYEQLFLRLYNPERDLTLQAARDYHSARVTRQAKQLPSQAGIFLRFLRKVRRCFSLPRSSTGTPPQLVKTMADYNVVLYEGQYYGLPQSLGQVEIDKDYSKIIRRNDVFIEGSLGDVLERINLHLG